MWDADFTITATNSCRTHKGDDCRLIFGCAKTSLDSKLQRGSALPTTQFGSSGMKVGNFTGMTGKFSLVETDCRGVR